VSVCTTFFWEHRLGCIVVQKEMLPVC